LARARLALRVVGGEAGGLLEELLGVAEPAVGVRSLALLERDARPLGERGHGRVGDAGDRRTTHVEVAKTSARRLRAGARDLADPEEPVGPAHERLGGLRAVARRGPQLGEDELVLRGGLAAL